MYILAQSGCSPVYPRVIAVIGAACSEARQSGNYMHCSPQVLTLDEHDLEGRVGIRKTSSDYGASGTTTVNTSPRHGETVRVRRSGTEGCRRTRKR